MAASIHFSCPNCNTRLSAEPDQYGDPASCPECQWTFYVPHFEEQEKVVKFFCPHCQRKLSANKDQWGHEMPCPFPECAKPVLVPHPRWKSVPTSIVLHGAPEHPEELIREAHEMTRPIHPSEEKGE